jgi:hypothetical protein
MRWQWIITALAAGAVAALAADVGIVVPPAGSVSEAAGQAQFRRGDFEEAARTFAAAVEVNGENARAWWGLGRVAEVQFQREKARDLFGHAYRIDPRDPEIVLSYLGGVTDVDARAVLLRNVMAVSRNTDPKRAEQADAQLEIDRRLGGKPAARLASEYTAYRVPLAGFRPVGATQDGLIVIVRVKGGKPLRLVLDTGARGILIDGRAAKNLGLEPVVASRLTGFGESEGGDSQLSLARSLSIGDLRFEDCLVEVSARSITPGADGILGVGIFEAFRLRVDPHRNVMELSPGGDTAPSPNAIGLSNLLLVKVAVAGREGWFLLDSGAAYSTVARDLVPPALRKGAADLVGVRGVQYGASRLGPMSFGAGGRTLVDMSPIALDLSPLSAREGVEISGVLGYSALSRRPFTIDLRHGVVTFE